MKQIKRQYVPYFFMMIFLFVAHSCFVAKEYTAPATSLEGTSYRADSLSNNDSNIGSQSWRQYFADPILIDHIQTGLENNNDLKIATQQMLKAQASLKQAKTGQLPAANFAAQATKSIDGDASDLFNMSASLSWEADIWGKIRSSKRAANASFLMTQENRAAVQAMLISRIAAAYLQLITLDEQLKITNSTIQIRSEQVKTMKAMKEAGMVNEMELQQSIAQHYLAQGLGKDLERQIFLQENMMSILLGQEPQKIERTTIDKFEMDSSYAAGVPSQLLGNRPDLKAAEFNLRNAFEQTNVARSQFYPSINITANAGYNGLELSKWVTPETFFFNAIGSLTQPIFNNRKLKTAHEIAKINQQEALIQFQDKLLNAGKEVSDALYKIENNKQQYEIKQKKLEAESKALELSKTLLKQGFINYLEVLVAQGNTLNAQLDLINLTNQKWANRIELYRALGGGVK